MLIGITEGVLYSFSTLSYVDIPPELVIFNLFRHVFLQLATERSLTVPGKLNTVMGHQISY